MPIYYRFRLAAPVASAITAPRSISTTGLRPGQKPPGKPQKGRQGLKLPHQFSKSVDFQGSNNRTKPSCLKCRSVVKASVSPCARITRKLTVAERICFILPFEQKLNGLTMQSFFDPDQIDVRIVQNALAELDNLGTANATYLCQCGVFGQYIVCGKSD